MRKREILCDRSNKKKTAKKLPLGSAGIEPAKRRSAAENGIFPAGVLTFTDESVRFIFYVGRAGVRGGPLFIHPNKTDYVVEERQGFRAKTFSENASAKNFARPVKTCS